jgi:nitrite reductase/ring-hydroxylating ferredoxin subunit
MSAKVTQTEEDTVRVEIGDDAYLIAAECPHRKGRMRYARVNERQRFVVCPLHYSMFDLETGAQRGGPSSAPLRTCRAVQQAAKPPQEK